MVLLPLLFGDATRVAILRLLASEPQGLTQRTIAARLGRSPSHVNKVVQALAALGVVTSAAAHRICLDRTSPLYQPLVETLQRFAELESYGRHLRTVIRAANTRFGPRYFVGGYLAVTRILQPIDFHSDRCDLYVKGLAPRDSQWVRPLRGLCPYDVRLHATKRIKGLVEEGATIDDESCLVATPEAGLFQCLDDPSFPRYGAFLLLVQALQEWTGDVGSRLQPLAQGTRWDGSLGPLLDHIQGHRAEAPPTLSADERRELRNAIATVKGA